MIGLLSSSDLDLRGVLRRGLLVWAFCVAISVLQVFANPEKRYPVELTFSLCIGTCCWLLADAARLLLRRAGDPGGWPHGVRGALLFMVSIGGGFLLGTAIANSLFGWPTFGSFGDLKQSVVITAVAGVGLVYFFDSRGRRARLQAAAQEAARAAAEARLKLLEVQLEPHMLFNTLANLRVLIASDPARAQQMLDHLIAYLRATLGGSRSTLHPLADEFARVADYLTLMQVRMGARLVFTLALPDELRNAAVPPLLLQPLVENAIRHGLEPQVAGGRITVRARRSSADAEGAPSLLVLEVQDDGAGLPGAADGSAVRRFVASDRHPDAVDGTGTANRTGTGTGGFGCAQVQQRLTTLYGSAGTLELIAICAGGTSARASFPYQIS